MKNKEIVKQVIQAFLNADLEKAFSYMTDDVKIGWPGFFDLEPGKNSLRKFFSNVPEIVSSHIGELIEEGDIVAGTGMMTSRQEDGSLKNSFFCDIYKLEHGKVKEIKSYMVFENKKEEV